jgi:secondary thiamine-phosphate synthase enzyme
MTVRTMEFQVDKPEEKMCISRITQNIERSIHDSGIRNGVATIFVGCTTASVSTMEYSPTAIKNMTAVLEKLAPSGADYAHHRSVGDANGMGADDNGNSHVRSTIMGPSVSIPFSNGRMLLDKSLDVVLLDFDLIKRKRKVIVQLMGE